MNVIIAKQLTGEGILESALKEKEDILENEYEKQKDNEPIISTSIVPKPLNPVMLLKHYEPSLWRKLFT